MNLSLLLSLLRVLSMDLSVRRRRSMWYTGNNLHQGHEWCADDRNERFFYEIFNFIKSLFCERKNHLKDFNIHDIIMVTKAIGILQINLCSHLFTFLDSIGEHTFEKAIFDIFDIFDEMKVQFPVLNEYDIPMCSILNPSHWHFGFLTKMMQDLDALDLEYLHYYVQFFDDIADCGFDITTEHQICQYILRRILKSMCMNSKIGNCEDDDIHKSRGNIYGRFCHKSSIFIIETAQNLNCDVHSVLFDGLDQISRAFGCEGANGSLTDLSIEISKPFGISIFSLLEVSFLPFKLISDDFNVSHQKLCHLMISITSDILRFGCSAIHERCIINIYIQLMKNRHFRNLYKCDIMESLSMMSCDKIYGSMSQLHVRSDRQPLRMFEVSRIPNSLQKNLKPIQGLLCYHFPLIVHRHIHLDEFMAIVASLNYHRFRFRCIRDENVRRIVSILSSSVQFTRDKIVDYDMYRSIISSILRLIRPRTTIENLEVFSVQMKCHLCTNLYTFLVDLELYVTLISLIMKYIIRINTLDMMKFVAVTMGHLMDLCVTIPYYHPLEVHDQLILIIRMFGYYINVLCSLCNCSKHVRKSCGRDLHLRNNSENQATDVAVSVLVSRGLLHLIQLLEVCPIYHKDPFRRSAHFCYTICGKVDKILSTFGDFFEVLHIPTIVSVFRKMLRPIFGALVAKPSCKKCISDSSRFTCFCLDDFFGFF